MLPFASLLFGCGSDDDFDFGELDFEATRPSLQNEGLPPPYSGSDPYVLEAAERHRTALDLQRNVVVRTCGPTGGVCHNQKEYPDLHTPANFINAISAPCNIQPADYTAVFDGCEPVGDKFQLNDDSSSVEVGYIDYIVGDAVDYAEGDRPDATSPGLHIYLHDALDRETGMRYGEGRLLRNFVGENNEVAELIFASFNAAWWVLDDGKHLMAEVEEYQVDQVNELLSVGVEQGDRNRNGVFGARDNTPLSLLEPGNAERSYLVGRLRGVLGGAPIPGTRMPLANEPLSIPDMLALLCFIEGLPEQTGGDYASINLSTPIDYENCSYSANPEGLNLLGQGVTWLGRVQPLLETNCGGCHGGAAPQGSLDLLADTTYDRLLMPSVQIPTLNLIEPNDPTRSYLWLKLNADPSILGSAMPVDPLAGVRRLSDASLADIATWINAGALEEN